MEELNSKNSIENEFLNDCYEEEAIEELVEDADLFIVKKKKVEPIIKEGEFPALIENVSAQKKLSGKFGKTWISIGLKHRIENPDTGEPVYLTFNASRSLNPGSRLYPVVKAILGSEPEDNFNLKELKGKKVWVTIKHEKDNKGNVWANIIAIRKYV